MTTVMTLSFTKALEALHYKGTDYFDKRVEFQKFIDLPRHTPVPLRLAMSDDEDLQGLKARGWQLIPSYSVSKTPEMYRQFLADSAGEWSIAKNFYVGTLSGWFSCRTACYLAAGRPAVVQDTAWTRYVPSGHGVFGFSTIEEAVNGLEKINAEPAAQRTAAYEVAREYLAADKVCTPMLESVFRGPRTAVLPTGTE